MLWFGSSHKQLGNVGVVLNPRILVVREEKEGLSLRNSIFSGESGLHQARRSAGDFSVGKFNFFKDFSF